MTKHNPNSTPVFTNSMPIAKRKGNRFRRFNPTTARMSPWFSDAPAKREATTNTDSLKRMRKAELQDLARTRGIRFNTKTTADALREALSV